MAMQSSESYGLRLCGIVDAAEPTLEARRPLRSPTRSARHTGRACSEPARAERLARHVTSSGCPVLAELQMAQLAVEGLSNREIGQRLYLSHRTVGSYRTG